MGRYIGPKCKLCRREGIKLFLKGERCISEKCTLERRPYQPGIHGRRWSKVSLYGLRLREKQKAKRIYGLREEQFKRYVERARRKKGVTGEHLLELLERRLDNVVYRGGLASSRNQARQLINHGHFWINGSVVNIPSYEVREGDVIEFKESSLRKEGIKNLAKTATNVPSWLERDNSRLRVVDRPNIEEIKDLQISLIVEFYSR